MLTSLLLLAPILLPLAAGAAIGYWPVVAPPPARKRFFLSALALTAASVLAVILSPDAGLELFRLTDRLPFLLRSDSLALLFCGFSSLVFLLVGFYSPVYMVHEGEEKRFYMFFLLVLGLLMGFGLAGNLMTLYLFFEVMTLCAVPLVLHSMEKEAIAAAFKFLYYSIAGASMALVGFFFIYQYGVSIEFVPGGSLDLQKLAGHETVFLAIILLSIIGFGAKAGMFPLHAWLPAAHPVAPAPASAILSGVITKAGVFATIRFVYYLVGPDFIRGTWAQTAWTSLTMLTILLGSVLAYREPVLKRRLAYSTISQVSYILFGLSVLSTDSFTGSLTHVLAHSAAKDALFLTAGAIILQTGLTDVADLRGIGKRMPVTMWCFTLLAIGLVGVPPTAGFISKWYLGSGAVGADIGLFTWLGPVILLLSALFTAAYMLPIAICGFFPGKEWHDSHSSAGGHSATNGHAATSGHSSAADPEGIRPASLDPAWSMLAPILILTAFVYVFGLFPGPLFSFFEGLAAGLFM